MKYVVEFYKDGELCNTVIREDHYDYDAIDRIHNSSVSDYRKQGYKEVLSCGADYCLLFNEKKLHSIVFATRSYILSDFLDSNGDPIICEKKYTGIAQNKEEYPEDEFDHYRLECVGYPVKYLVFRNESKQDTHKWVDGHPVNVHPVKSIVDKHITQEFLDTLKLKPTE